MKSTTEHNSIAHLNREMELLRMEMNYERQVYGNLLSP